jgi:NADH-quinone oxidoreductase chain G
MGILVDDRFYDFEGNNTIFQFCLKKGIDLPCFCYHERLSIAGNCRICLVEVNTVLVVSCAISLMDHMVIHTKNKRVRRSRESILEFLLVNHPLDCPICDQGGECDLQDIVISYGSDRGRFYETTKRSVDNLNCCGPLIKTIMTRCIHCTRCVRFMQEIAGAFDLGVIGRGNNMEIGVYIERLLFHELIGNVIDLCPVGALTSMPFAFTARPWELQGVRSIDILDSLASSIRIDVLNNKVMRVLPLLNESINEEWITNKIRYVYDAFNVQRLYYPKFNIAKKFVVVSWKAALYLFLHNLFLWKNLSIEAVCGPFLDLEACLSLKGFFLSLGCSSLSYFDSALSLSCDFRAFYFLGHTLKCFEGLDNVLFLGAHPRFEAPLLNTRVRKNFLTNPFSKFYSLGLAVDNLNYPVKNLGNSANSLLKFLEGKFSPNFALFLGEHLSFNFLGLNSLKKTYFLLGPSLSSRLDFKCYLRGLLSFLKVSNFSLNSFGLISKFLGRLSACEVGFPFKFTPLSNQAKRSKFLFLCGVDYEDVNLGNLAENFTIYQGSFYAGNFLACLNLVLPACTFTEKFSSFLNLEGRLRFTQKAVSPFKSAFLDWKILQALGLVKKHLFIYNFSRVSKFYALLGFFRNTINYFCYFYYFLDFLLVAIFFSAPKTLCFSGPFDLRLLFKSVKAKFNNTILSKSVLNYYATDVFTKNSKILSICASKSPFNSFSTFFSGF